MAVDVTGNSASDVVHLHFAFSFRVIQHREQTTIGLVCLWSSGLRMLGFHLNLGVEMEAARRGSDGTIFDWFRIETIVDCRCAGIRFAELSHLFSL